MTYPELQDSVETLNQLRRDRVAQELAELREHEIATQEHRLQRAVAEAEVKGRAEGEAKLRSGVEDLCTAQGIVLDATRQAQLRSANRKSSANSFELSPPRGSGRSDVTSTRRDETGDVGTR